MRLVSFTENRGDATVLIGVELPAAGKIMPVAR
jgi:hypothetical protein